ncbi:hypothetical protein [Pseudoalteromonas phage J2-1_QLiu-2017]|nr:hypothetical protein [Pseudoalteromonas phage J2-1_QLiu-2017]
MSNSEYHFELGRELFKNGVKLPKGAPAQVVNGYHDEQRHSRCGYHYQTKGANRNTMSTLHGFGQFMIHTREKTARLDND